MNNKKIDFLKIAGILLLLSAVLSLFNNFLNISNISDNSYNLVKVYENLGMNITIDFNQARQLLLSCGVIGIILSIFSIFGALLCFKKKYYVFALIFSILGIFSIGILFSSSILSLIALILIIVSKEEFLKEEK